MFGMKSWKGKGRLSFQFELTFFLMEGKKLKYYHVIFQSSLIFFYINVL